MARKWKTSAWRPNPRPPAAGAKVKFQLGSVSIWSWMILDIQMQFSH